MRALVFIVFTMFGCSLMVSAQPDTVSLDHDRGFDTLKINMLPEVTITGLPDLSNYDDRRDYYVLRKKVLKVWPYAKEAAEQLYGMEYELEGEDRQRKRKKYAKDIQKYMAENFKDTLKTLTRSEGVVLVKLVNRETGRTTHEIIKEYRGGMNAMFWQTMAAIYDNDLKYEFDPKGNRDDAWIDNIVERAQQSGLIEPVRKPVKKLP